MKTDERDIGGGFAFAWILRFSLVSFLGGAVLFVVLEKIFSKELGENFGHAFVILKNLDQLLLPAIGFSILFYALVVVAMVVIMTFFISHHITVPLFQLESFAKHIGRCDLSTPIPLKRGDQLAVLYGVVARMQDSMVQQLLPIRARLDAMDKAWAKLDAAPKEKYEEAALLSLQTIEEELSSIKNSISA
jgi:methyl-accepting chemotaxis protein